MLRQDLWLDLTPTLTQNLLQLLGTGHVIVLAAGADGYQVAFSLAELDAGWGNETGLVADEMTG
jgi:hypothetical protein